MALDVSKLKSGIESALQGGLDGNNATQVAQNITNAYHDYCADAQDVTGDSLQQASKGAMEKVLVGDTSVPPGPVTVTINYNGANIIDEQHKVFIYIYDSKDITNSNKLFEGFITSNGQSYTFEEIQQPTVFVFAFLDKDGDGKLSNGDVFAPENDFTDSSPIDSPGDVTITFSDIFMRDTGNADSFAPFKLLNSSRNWKDDGFVKIGDIAENSLNQTSTIIDVQNGEITLHDTIFTSTGSPHYSIYRSNIYSSTGFVIGGGGSEDSDLVLGGLKNSWAAVQAAALIATGVTKYWKGAKFQKTKFPPGAVSELKAFVITPPVESVLKAALVAIFLVLGGTTSSKAQDIATALDIATKLTLTFCMGLTSSGAPVIAIGMVT
jgi:uncharacterized protein (DUF2141 family)